MPTSSSSTESINEVILRLLELEDVFDLDYETYFTLLKEAVIRYGVVGKEKIDSSELELLREELKRIKAKPRNKRFSVKTKKISSDNFLNKKAAQRFKKSITSSNFKSNLLLPSNNVSGSIEKSSPNQLDGVIDSIKKSVESIYETLLQQQSLLLNEKELNRRKSEREKRGDKEAKLEKRFEKLKAIASKIIAPVKSVLDRIIDFLVNVFLGRSLIKLLDWLADPSNSNKVKSIIRFLTDWWPTLLGGYILFGTKFGKFTRTIVGIVLGGLARLTKFAIPKLLSFIRKNPKAAAAVGLFTAGATIPAMFPQTVNEQERKTTSASGSAEDKIRALQQQKANLNLYEKLQGKGGEIDEQISYLQTGKTKSYGFSNGGFVSGETGVDKVPAMLSDGEFVMSRGAVSKFGLPFLETINSLGGGNNQPKIIGGVPHAAGGGYIGNDKMEGGMPSITSLKPVVDEILRGLSPQYDWAKNLARRTGVSVQGSANSMYNTFMNEGAKMHGYLTRGGLQNNVQGLQKNISQYGADTFNYLNSKDFQNNLKEKGTQLVNAGKLSTSKALTGIEKLQLGKKYQDMAEKNQAKTNEKTSSYDSWIKGLPGGFIKDTMNRGLIPIPTFNEKGMTIATFAKAMAGPLGRPFRIMSNDVVDRARQEMVNRTANAQGLRVDPKTGKLSMDWNRVGKKGSGQYTDELTSLRGGSGKFFNSTFGRWSGYEKEGKIVTDDVYNFNETVGSYAKKSRDSLMKGNVGEALYNLASMSGRFAQDIGWLNQRVLGSEVEVGSTKNIDRKTGKALNYSRGSEKMGPPVPKQTPAKISPTQNRNRRGIGVRTRPKPKVVYGPPAPTTGNKYKGGQRGSRQSTPNFKATHGSGFRTKAETLGLMR